MDPAHTQLLLQDLLARQLFSVEIDEVADPDDDFDYHRYAFHEVWPQLATDGQLEWIRIPGGRQRTLENGPATSLQHNLITEGQVVLARLAGPVGPQVHYELIAPRQPFAGAYFQDATDSDNNSDDWDYVDGILGPYNQTQRVGGTKQFLGSACVGDARDDGAGGPNETELMNVWFGSMGTASLNVAGQPYSPLDQVVSQGVKLDSRGLTGRPSKVQGLIRVSMHYADTYGRYPQAMTLYVRRRGSSPDAGSRITLLDQPAQGPVSGDYYTFALTGDDDPNGKKPAYAIGGMDGFATLKVGKWGTYSGLVFSGGLLTGGSLVAPPLADGTYGDIVVSASGTVFTIGNGAVTSAKMHASGTNVLFGRSSSGAGAGEEVTCTAAGRALLDDADAAAQRATLGLDTMATQAASSVAITGGSITGLSSPSVSSEAATKGYVDTLAMGLAWKAPVVAATTGAGTLASSFENGDTIDGVTLATGDRILIKDQSDATQNGIYVVAASGAPSRATDADTGAELVSAAVLVRSGTTNADRLYTCTNDSITLGSTNITFTNFAASTTGVLVAANNLSDLTSPSTARTNLGLGDAATKNIGTSGANVPLLNGTNTWGGSQLYITGPKIYDTDLTHTMTIVNNDNFTGDRSFNIVLNDASRTITFSGNLTVSSGGATVGGTNTGDQTITLTGPVTGSGTGSFATTITTNAITDAMLRQSAGLSVIGRSANSTGNVADMTAANDGDILRRSGTSLGFGPINMPSITALTATDIASGDEVPIYDVSATANKKVTVARMLGYGHPEVCDLRLTTETGVAVSTSDRTSQGTIYLTPYMHFGTAGASGYGRISLCDGTRWLLYELTAEISLSLSISSGTNYDVFLYDNSGTLTMETLAWTDNTNRATELQLLDGVLVKTSATTRRYMGTIRGSGSNVTEDSKTKRFVWSHYHRRPRKLQVTDTTNTWTYTADSYRQARGSSANQVEAVIGVEQEPVDLQVFHQGAWDSGAFTPVTGVGVDSTTVNSCAVFNGNAPVSGSAGLAYARYRDYPGIGYHYFAWLERSSASTGTVTWVGDFGGTRIQTGMVGEVWG